MSEKIGARIGNARILVTDAAGAPIIGKEVRFKLRNHEFLFACGAFDSIPAVSEIPDDMIDFYHYDNAKGHDFYLERMRLWRGIFNYATLPFYWGKYEPVEGAPFEESRRLAASYLKERDVIVKGHPLCWHTACANWLLAYDNHTILEKQLARIHREVTNFKGLIDRWDVINETVIMPVYDRYDNPITRICKEYGRVPLIKEVFAAAHEANPEALLLINDFNLSDDYRRVIDECLNAGVPIGAIGLQSHQHKGYRGIAWFEDVIRRFSVFGLPLHLTENTLLSGEIMPSTITDLNDWVVDSWPGTPEGEARQAREWEEIVRLLFSTEQVEAVTGWDFADGGWLHAPSGFVRADNSRKPVYDLFDRLIHEEWDTDVTLTTDEAGYVTLEGYRGTYAVTADGLTGKVVLTKEKEATVSLQ